MRPLVLVLLLLAACRSEVDAVDTPEAESVVARQEAGGEPEAGPYDTGRSSMATGAQGQDFELRRATSRDVLAHVAASPARVKVVNFWATWCVPCREEFPDLVRLQRELHDEGVEVIFVSADFLDQEADALQFLAEQGATGLSFLKDEKDDDFISAFDDTWSGELPTTIVYGPDDAKAAVFTRKVTYDEIRRRVLSLSTSSSS